MSVIFGFFLFFYIAYSSIVMGKFVELLIRGLFRSNDSKITLGSVSCAWLSGTIFVHRLEFRRKDFCLVISEAKVRFAWWTKNVVRPETLGKINSLFFHPFCHMRVRWRSKISVRSQSNWSRAVNIIKSEKMGIIRENCERGSGHDAASF